MEQSIIQFLIYLKEGSRVRPIVPLSIMQYTGRYHVAMVTVYYINYGVTELVQSFVDAAQILPVK